MVTRIGYLGVRVTEKDAAYGSGQGAICEQTVSLFRGRTPYFCLNSPRRCQNPSVTILETRVTSSPKDKTMHKTFRYASAFTLCLAAAPVHAEEHTIVLTGFSYFPAITYLSAGDTVRFINESGEEQTVVGKDVGWVVGPLQDSEEGLLTVNEETELAFYSAYQPSDSESDVAGGDDAATASDDPNYGDYENARIKAEVTFDPAPLDEDT